MLIKNKDEKASISYKNKKFNFIEYYHRVIKSKDGKVLFDNLISLSLLQVAGYIFPLITIPYLSRVIGVDKFGEIAFASAIIAYFQTVSDWGFNYTATRDIAKNRDNKDKVSQIFSSVMWARLLLTVLSFIVLLILILIIPKFRETSALILITFCLIPGHIMFPEWLFQGLERMKYITILNIIAKAFFTIAVFVFIREKSDFILQPLFTSLGYIISGLIAMYFILIRWKIRFIKPSLVDIKTTIIKSTDVFINNIMPNLYNNFSVLLLGFFAGSVSNGKLDAGSKFVNIASSFNALLSRAFYPFLSRKINKHDLYAKISICIAIILSFILFLLAPFLIKVFFTAEFYDGIVVLRIMSISIPFLTLSNIYGTNYMIIEGYEKTLRNITVRSSLIGFVISIPLVYKFDYIGAAVTITLTRAILGIGIMYRGLKIRKDKLLL